MLPRWFPAIFCFFLAAACALPLPAQEFDFQRGRVPMAELTGPWRFHTGDDPDGAKGWAEPAFVDSAWSLLTAGEGWAQQGYEGFGGVAWYRLAIVLPPQHGPLALYLPNVDTGCQVFANGRLIGAIGSLPPHPHTLVQKRTVLSIPEDLARGERLLIAIRVWLDPRLARSRAGGLHPAPRIGDAEAIAEWRLLQGRELYWETSASMIELSANLLGALACLIVFALRRKEREYLWFGLYLLNWSAYHVVTLYSAFRPAPYYPLAVLTGLLLGLGPYIGAEYFRALARQSRGWAYLGAAFFAIASACAIACNAFWPHPLWNLAHVGGLTVYWVFMGLILIRAWNAGTRDTAILLAPVAWGLAEAIFFVLANSPAFLHQAGAQALLRFMEGGTRWPIPYYVPSLVGDLTNVVVLVVLIRRYARSRRDEERFASEMEAARAVQRAHIPSELPEIPGYRVQAIYRPASHVGGDFFQIVPLEAGRALVVVGDVSGKGLPAAMTVSLLVGTFRTLTHYTESPGEILAAMNQRMLARSSGGFTTCLILRVEPGGRLTLANAGHLSPYLDGAEIEVPGGLPLGLAASSTYPEIAVALPLLSQLTLLTDGVVEARNAAGELFGFDRTAALAGEPADQIALRAHDFGQEDDITVLTLVRQPA
ncbi:MAG: PP2C family protein-serine/threonine phosphatase [Terracidiphilus sp.]